MTTVPKAITFDAAGTLIEVRFDGPEFLAQLAGEFGHPVEVERVREAYLPVMAEHVERHARAVRSGRDPGGKALWTGIYAEVLRRAGRDITQETGRALTEASAQRLFGPDSEYWALFPDVVETLKRLRERRVRLAVVSNWDASLHGVLDRLGIYDYFEFVLASLEVGWEKPDRRLFGAAVRRFGYEPFQVMHVGDNLLDDVEGARQAGLFPVLIDREDEHPNTDCARITTLTDLAGLYD